ncbi:MAG: hypothetical protein L7H18_03425 [Candidatus Nealsonbacteria bacterium DGGOD1a]|nr:MAG: hypothetical protein L7H18_03425 [Candidatus Nealsonbacteria bacterium DGGOD1a]
MAGKGESIEEMDTFAKWAEFLSGASGLGQQRKYKIEENKEKIEGPYQEGGERYWIKLFYSKERVADDVEIPYHGENFVGFCAKPKRWHHEYGLVVSQKKKIIRQFNGEAESCGRSFVDKKDGLDRGEFLVLWEKIKSRC